MDSTGVFHDPADAYDSGCCDRALGTHVSVARIEAAGCAAPGSLALDVSAVAVCVGDGSGDLLTSIPSCLGVGRDFSRKSEVVSENLRL